MPSIDPWHLYRSISYASQLTYFFHSLGLDPPWYALSQHHTRFVWNFSELRNGGFDYWYLCANPRISRCIDTIWIHNPHQRQGTFPQTGSYKRHVREHHQIPCNLEDLYNPLRDTVNGHPVSRHCLTVFKNFHRLRDHISRFVSTSIQIRTPSCPSVTARTFGYISGTKASRVLLLNRALVSELAHHCTYCHNAINARSIRKHYKDAHPQFLAFEHLHKAQIYGLASQPGVGPWTMGYVWIVLRQCPDTTLWNPISIECPLWLNIRCIIFSDHVAHNS